MPQTVQSNNENEFRLTRSKVQQQQNITSTTTQLSKTTISTTTINTELTTNHQHSSQSTEALEQIQSQQTTRQYLGDVSNQYITRQPLPNSTTTNKRKPLGGDNAPLQQQNKLARPIPIPNDNKLSSLAVPSRLPQKRQATESSTNLVEKLRIPDSAADNTESYHKKSRLIDYEWQDLDEEDIDDPLMASEYVNDIFSYFYELETRMLPDPQYLTKPNTHLKPRMRSILVDWLVEMHLKFRLLPESLFLAINIMDRFMSIETVQIDRLQLLATGSLFIAAKYEEVFSPG